MCVTNSRLHIVGCGRLGRAMAKLFRDAHLVDEIGVCNRSLESGERAVEAIGGGAVYESVRGMPPSSLWLVGCGDEAIPQVVQTLLSNAKFDSSAVVFHCSGVLSSQELAPLRERGCHVASVHPIRSFADTTLATDNFSGTFCGVEGDSDGVAVVRYLFSRVGGEVFHIPTESKLVLHAGHVFASNYLVALLKVARDLYAAAGIPEDLSWCLMEPLVRGTVDNVAQLGPIAALTGPIARGEGSVVERQLNLVREISPRVAEIYARFGEVALDLAREQGLSEERYRLVAAALRSEGSS